MLLVHPIRELLRFLPVLIGLVVAGTASRNDGPPWLYLGVAVPIVLGVLRYLTTGFRIAEGRVELRYGLLSRHVLSTPLDRVRTVDLTASPIHRVLGVTTLRIGTGGSGEGSDQLDLDGLPVDRAHALRRGLLRVAEPQQAPHTLGPGDVPTPRAGGAPHRRLRPVLAALRTVHRRGPGGRGGGVRCAEPGPEHLRRLGPGRQRRRVAGLRAGRRRRDPLSSSGPSR